MIIGAIIQARMASTRLPGKVLLPLKGMPMLQFQIERLKKSKMLNSIGIATSKNPENKAIIELANKMGIPVFAGSEKDVLDRYYQAAKQFGFDVIVRITGDCPLADPAIVDSVIKRFLEDKVDYSNNIDPPTFPDGFDVEVFTFAALEKAWKESTAQHHREHVTAFIRETEGFKKTYVQNPIDLSKLRLTVDNKEDFEIILSLVSFLPDNFSLQDVLKALEEHPELKEINARFVRDEKYWSQVREWRNKK